MLAFLGSLPVIGQFVTAITTAIFDARVRITQAKVGGDRDVAVEIVKTSAQEGEQQKQRLGIIASNKVLTTLVVAFSVPLVLFWWKIVVYDIVLELGTTDPLRGQAADWANTIIWFIFGAPTALSLGKMWFANRSS